MYVTVEYVRFEEGLKIIEFRLDHKYHAAIHQSPTMLCAGCWRDDKACSFMRAHYPK